MKDDRRKILIRNIVEVLKDRGIHHECDDIKEQPIELILQEYGFYLHCTEEEEFILRYELLDLAAQAEIAEAVRRAQTIRDPIEIIEGIECEVI